MKKKLTGAPRQVRIIGGLWKRTPLPVLDAEGLRPTPDRVRETVFNWLGFLQKSGWSQIRCLDLFAGSGALGFEAASRGAASVLMGYGGGMLRTQVSIVETGMQAAEAVVNGSAAAAYLTRAQAEAVLFKHGNPQHIQLSPMQLPGLPGNGWPVGMAIKSQHKELGQAIEAALHALRSRGELLALFRQQGLTLTAP